VRREVGDQKPHVYHDDHDDQQSNLLLEGHDTGDQQDAEHDIGDCRGHCRDRRNAHRSGRGQASTKRPDYGGERRELNNSDDIVCGSQPGWAARRRVVRVVQRKVADEQQAGDQPCDTA
jgi:hypothetical protein